MAADKVKRAYLQSDVQAETEQCKKGFDAEYIKEISLQNAVPPEAQRFGTSFDAEYIKEISLQNAVPIIRDDTRRHLVAALQKYRPNRVLEIGGGMGYSASVILKTLCSPPFSAAPQKFISIEKNEARYLVLKQVIASAGGVAIWDDAYNVTAKLVADSVKRPSGRGFDDGGLFDFVFLDGPKAQYGRYFNLIHRLLARGGVIFADNTDFHGMVPGTIPTTKGAGTIVKGLRDFRAELGKYRYQISYSPDGDGIIIAVKR
jgi:predicted O-methyltransferase YrrM